MDRNLEIHINATAAGLEKGVQRAEASLSRLRGAHAQAWAAINATEQWLQAEADAALREVEAREARRQEVWQATGTVVAAAGVAIGAGLTAASRAAMQWESDWAGVEKVLDATPGQMAALEEQVRGLALSLPATSTEIAQTAAAAAQLGVANEHLTAFTETAVMLGTATNMASDEAATGLARLSTVMGVSYSDINRMGSSIVALGNNFAATESEILEMSLRLSGAGNQIGLTAGEVMGLATAFSSVGIQADLGGGAFSRSLGRIQTAVLAGGQRLEQFGEIAGVTAEEFAEAFRTAPAEAIIMFLDGLNRINQSGGDVYATLRTVGLTGTEIADVMTRASAASGQVAEAMGVGNRAFTDANALLEEAAARYETTESKVQLAKNSINDLGISIGETLLPVIGEAAETTSQWVSYLGTMPEGVQTAVTGTTALAGAATLAAGAFVLGVPRIAEFNQSLADMGPRTQAVGRGLGAVAGVLGGPWGIAIGAAVVAGGLFIDSQAEAASRVASLTEALIASSGVIDDNVRRTAAKALVDEGIAELAREAGISIALVTDAYLGQSGAMDQLNAEIESAIETGTTWNDTLLGNEASYNEAAHAASSLHMEMTGLSGEAEEAVTNARDYQAAMGDTAATVDGAAESTAGLTAGQHELAGALSESAAQVTDLKTKLEELTGVNVSAVEAEIGFRDSVQAATEALATNGTTLDLNTEAGRRNMDALIRVRDETINLTSATRDQTGSTEQAREAFERGRKKFVEVAIQMGATADEAEQLAEEMLGIPEDIHTDITVNAAGKWFMDGGGVNPMTGNGIRPGFNSGGAVVGPGGPTDDLIPAMLSNGEHVLTAAEVEKAGGQDGVYRLRAAIRAGYVRFAVGGAVGDPQPQRFARGGAVSPLPPPAQAISDHREDVRINIQRMYMAVVDGVARDVGRQLKTYLESGGPVVAAARSQLGVPYSWGGGGPNGPSRGFGRGAGTIGFDCSSLMQYAWYQGARVSLPRVTYDQINTGHAVTRGAEMPGDLVFPHRGHVAMVASPGRLIHAPYTGAVVSYRPMYAAPIAIRRPRRVFDTGGIWGSGTPAENLSGLPERVLSPRQTRAFEQLVDGLLARPAAPVHAPDPAAPIVVNINHVPGYSTPQDVALATRHLERVARVGRRT